MRGGRARRNRGRWNRRRQQEMEQTKEVKEGDEIAGDSERWNRQRQCLGIDTRRRARQSRPGSEALAASSESVAKTFRHLREEARSRRRRKTLSRAHS